MIPWTKGKPLVLDVTVKDTFADSHNNCVSAEVGAATKYAMTFRESKYADITSTQLFYPVAIETAGAYDVLALELIEEIGYLIPSHLQQL